MRMLLKNYLLILMAGLFSITFVNCMTDKKSKSPELDNKTVVHVDSMSYANRGFSTLGELSWKEIMMMDSLEKRQFYLALTDSLPDLWKTMDVDAITYTIEDTIPSLPADKIIHLHYIQKVNDFRVWVDFIKLYDGLDIGRAILHFSKPGHSFQVYCDAFSDKQLVADSSYHLKGMKSINLSKIKPGDNVMLDYINPQKGEYLSNFSPFYFKDMDFDGEDELVVNNLSMGPRRYSTYNVFKINHGKKPFRLKGLPFTDDLYQITNYNVEYEPETKCVIDKRYDGSDAYGHYRYQSIPSNICIINGNSCKRVFILKEAEDMGFYHPKNRSASDSVNLLQPYKKYRRENGKMVLVERGVYERGHYGRYLKDVVLEKKLSNGK